MIVFAETRMEVSVNPKDVIKKLIESEIGWRNWVFEKDNKYYRGFEISAGTHSFEDAQEITKEKFEYVTALQLVLQRMV